ncbi:uncharacterized protein LOC132618901 isoform X2 [Lycium barbarum]|uniref:uncharacterized protein LOC132618901 isoform X2 n=1 Tax=Lycium barbarum TaxID=112863 RepID=UPI00293F2734|nr:uncharacterized protein LOC132618901 isoform X2 [Lycium barbarum]
MEIFYAKDEACVATNDRNMKAESITLSPLHEGISKLLSQWPGLQMAIENEWGGQDSPKKSKQLSSDIFSCLSQSNAAVGVEDVENMLYERLLLSFNTDIDDGSIEEVAEQLMTLREEYVQGKSSYTTKK